MGGNFLTNYYRVLGVATDADAEVIAAAYKALARKYHPDTGGSAASQERTRVLNEAYAILRDPEARTAYDGEIETTTYESGSGKPDLIEAVLEATPIVTTEEARPKGFVDRVLDVPFLLIGVPVLFILGMFLADVILQWVLSIIGGLLGSEPYSIGQAVHNLKEVLVSSFNAATSQEPSPKEGLTIAATAFSAAWLFICAYAASGAVASLSWENRPRIPLLLITVVLVAFVLLLAWRKYTSEDIAVASEQTISQMVQYVAALGGVLASYRQSKEERTTVQAAIAA